LDCLLHADYWSDAAYVAERVLTPEELMTYVDHNSPAPRADDQPRNRDHDAQSLRNLLARRLTRLGRWKEARPYFAADLRPRLDAYVAAIRSGHDTRQPAEQRAAALWLAACLARHHGMELLATEVGPDNAQCDGMFPDADTAGFQQERTQAKLVGASAEELSRIARSAPQPEKRWHYRYLAAEHAWSAAALMPDRSDDTAKVLCTAGSWIKDKDPQAADRFYKALVRRCGNTTLGAQAASLHWFPKIEDPPAEFPASPKP